MVELMSTRQEVLVSVKTKKGTEVWKMLSEGMVANNTYHP